MCGSCWSSPRFHRQRPGGPDQSGVDVCANAPADAPGPGAASRWPSVFFLKLSPWRRMKRQTVSCETSIPSARRSAASARTVQSDLAARRLLSVSDTLRRIGERWPPIFRGARPCPAHASWPIRTAEATDTPNRFAASRTVEPSASASATRTRKSRDSGRTIAAGLLPSSDLESRVPRVGESKSRFNDALTDSKTALHQTGRFYLPHRIALNSDSLRRSDGGWGDGKSGWLLRC